MAAEERHNAGNAQSDGEKTRLGVIVTALGGKSDIRAVGESVQDMLEGVRTRIDETLKRRENTVMVRVDDDALKHLDMLVEAGICKSRSESAALLIDRGLNAMEPLFERIRGVTEQIHDLREQLKDLLAKESSGNQENASAS
jgi:hypothetical protein